MGIFSGILKGLGAIAAPFTGGASLALTGLGAAGDVLSKIGQTSGASAKGMADARLQEALLSLQRDRLGQDRATGNIDADQKRYRQLAIMSLLNNTKNAQVTGLRPELQERIPVITGGFNPEMLAGGMRDPQFEEMRQRILKTLPLGQHLPDLTPLPRANLMEKGLGITGLLSGLLGSLPKKGAPAPSPGVPPDRLIGQLPGISFK